MSKSARALRKIFLERHKEWEASNNPHGIRSGQMRTQWEKRMIALMNLGQCEQEIYTAPRGRLRIVHVDARDRTPTRYGDYADVAAVRKAFSSMLVAQYKEMKVFDDRGKEVKIEF